MSQMRSVIPVCITSDTNAFVNAAKVVIGEASTKRGPQVSHLRENPFVNLVSGC